MSYQEAVLSFSTVFLAWLSHIACICVCVSIYNKGYTPCQLKCNVCKRKKQHNHEHLAPLYASSQPAKTPNQANIILFWMCTVDGFHMLQIVINWFPQILPGMMNNWYWNTTQCTIIGVTAQFCAIQGASWHILLAYYLGYLLCGGDLQKKIKTMYDQRYIHYILVNLIPLIGTIIPFFMNSNNGYHINVLDGDKDCWVIGHSQYIFIIAISMSLLLHYSVLTIAFIKFKRSNYKRYQIVVKLSKFVVVYTIIRFFPLIERIYEIFASVPYWLVLLQHISIALLGMGNALVWFWNSNVTQTTINTQNKLNQIHAFHEQQQRLNMAKSSISGIHSINTASMNNTGTITNMPANTILMESQEQRDIISGKKWENELI